MGQSITVHNGALYVTMSCDCGGCGGWQPFMGLDLIEIRRRAHAEGWRQRMGKWYIGICVPVISKEDEE